MAKRSKKNKQADAYATRQTIKWSLQEWMELQAMQTIYEEPELLRRFSLQSVAHGEFMPFTAPVRMVIMPSGPMLGM
jgi:hypothetical protein